MTHLSVFIERRPDAGSPPTYNGSNRLRRYIGTKGLVNEQDVRKTYAIMRGAAHGISFSCFTLERQPGRKPKNPRRASNEEGQQ